MNSDASGGSRPGIMHFSQTPDNAAATGLWTMFCIASHTPPQGSRCAGFLRNHITIMMNEAQELVLEFLLGDLLWGELKKKNY